MGLFIPKETLDALSYRSTLGRSLKQISLRAHRWIPFWRISRNTDRAILTPWYRRTCSVPASKVTIPSFENMRKRFEPTGALSSASTMCLVFACALKNTLRSFRTISGSSTSAAGSWWMTAIVRSIYTISGTIWLTRSRCSFGAGMTTISTSGAINTFINIRHLTLGRNCTRSTQKERSGTNGIF